MNAFAAFTVAPTVPAPSELACGSCSGGTKAAPDCLAFFEGLNRRSGLVATPRDAAILVAPGTAFDDGSGTGVAATAAGEKLRFLLEKGSFFVFSCAGFCALW